MSVSPRSDALAGLAEDPEGFIPLPTGAQRVDGDGFCLAIGPRRRWAGVCRLRLDDEGDVARVIAEVRRRTSGIESVVWNVGSSATPAGLPHMLRERGLVDPAPPLDPVVAALVLERPPLGESDIEVRRVSSLDDHMAGLEIMLAASTWPEAAAADERRRARETYASREQRGSTQWLAIVDGAPVAWAGAERARAGLFLSGGATLPDARGRGCYRALVHARWQEAIRLGLAGLAVQSQYGSSYPILRSLGFVEVAQVHTLELR